MTWWRAKGKKNQGWLYFGYPEGEGPHAAVHAVLGSVRTLEPVDEPPRLHSLGLAVHGEHSLELYCEGA